MHSQAIPARIDRIMGDRVTVELAILETQVFLSHFRENVLAHAESCDIRHHFDLVHAQVRHLRRVNCAALHGRAPLEPRFRVRAVYVGLGVAKEQEAASDGRSATYKL